MSNISLRIIALSAFLAGSPACKPTDFAGSGQAKRSGSSADGKGNPGDPDKPGNDGEKLGKVGTSDDKGNPGKKDPTLGEDTDGAQKRPDPELETDDGEKKKCFDQELKTKVKLLTLTVANGKPGNKITYEISVVDCNGDYQPVSGKNILFDIDAEVDAAMENTYTARVGLESISGTLNTVEGVDLFGKTGPEFFHHRTDKTVSLKGTITAVILTVDLHGQSFLPIGGGDNGTFLVNTHLKFGDADPVTQPVMFIE
jgi:hypothetical protein